MMEKFFRVAAKATWGLAVLLGGLFMVFLVSWVVKLMVYVLFVEEVPW